MNTLEEAKEWAMDESSYFFSDITRKALEVDDDGADVPIVSILLSNSETGEAMLVSTFLPASDGKPFVTCRGYDRDGNASSDVLSVMTFDNIVMVST